MKYTATTSENLPLTLQVHWASQKSSSWYILQASCSLSSPSGCKLHTFSAPFTPNKKRLMKSPSLSISLFFGDLKIYQIVFFNNSYKKYFLQKTTSRYMFLCSVFLCSNMSCLSESPRNQRPKHVTCRTEELNKNWWNTSSLICTNN